MFTFDKIAPKKVLTAGLSFVKASRTKLLFVLLASLFLYFGVYKYFYVNNLLGFGTDTNKSVTIEEVINPKDGKVIKLKKETEQFQSAKTFWDWLGLAGTLAIPLVLYLFQANAQRRAEERAKVEKLQAEERAKVEQDIAEDNLREQALEAYIDRMAEILINPETRSELLTKESGFDMDNSIRDVARIRTVTILRRLEDDIKRQNRILHFLYDCGILKFLLKNSNFANANLKGFNFNGINLNNAVFSEANLSGAKFSNCQLIGANFINANLDGVDFTNANLFGAIFNGANLHGANFQNARIQNTNFTNADLSNASLIESKTWDEQQFDNNCINVPIEGDDSSSPDLQTQFVVTDFSGANLTNTNLLFTNLRGAKNLTLEQLKKAKNWDDAIYDQELYKELKLPAL
ncbi:MULTISPECIES: pentapeptide repeat-containing protein [unclassified Tolypothrix]|uniref:pentapeptide repeat-containing protein n=1 Tax=unclassified Tolypothrix TaxID=2649714 RepID=UPI0005EAC51B|nr:MULTISPECIES: pentapeptide repeat-containing protein [unclassified Tolypothrix]EKE96435.1 pentapeptide repeat membrane protein [Tolypothrix sp. PCC 7601]MBE9084134.1 pentapeptide repeat-containing protein [Tolypothrix sp. LEGE 11397]UYD31039.1 pentapeptide repeat-containing protein [Tolypothrix sp. PCC 7712]BAY96009.1 hypothetical protein NIES3275_80860 [Microchaete diplosiphon NIES-3275]